jgi:hypothetical protein
LCILTPIFRDYERHLDEINKQELKRQHKKGADTTEKNIKSPESCVIEWCVLRLSKIFQTISTICLMTSVRNILDRPMYIYMSLGLHRLWALGSLTPLQIIS